VSGVAASSADPAPPSGRAERYRVGLLSLLSLVAGRASYRLVVLATNTLLWPVWGRDRYGTYAAAVAAFGWLTVLMLGPEKAMLKLLPRAPRTGPVVTAALVAVLWWLPLPVVAAFAAVRLVDGPGSAAVHVGVAGMFLSVGCTMVLVGLHRAAGRTRVDTATFLVMSAAQLALLGAAAVGLLQPVGFVAAVTVVQVCLNVVLSTGLGRPSLALRHRPRFLRRLVATGILLSATDLFVLLSTAILFVLLQVAGHADVVPPLYVLLLVVSAGTQLLMYLLRVYAPRTSLLLVGRAGAAGRVRAARLARVVVVVIAAWLAVVGVLLATTGAARGASPSLQVVIWSALLVSGAPTVALLLWASYLLENSDARAPGVVAAGAAVGLLTVAATGAVVIPALGGTGLIVSNMAGQLGFAAVIAARGASSRYRSAAAAPDGAAAASTVVPWRGQRSNVTRSAPGGTRSSSSGRRE
jgi:hypothetical protein